MIFIPTNKTISTVRYPRVSLGNPAAGGGVNTPVTRPTRFLRPCLSRFTANGFTTTSTEPSQTNL